MPFIAFSAICLKLLLANAKSFGVHEIHLMPGLQEIGNEMSRNPIQSSCIVRERLSAANPFIRGKDISKRNFVLMHV